MIINLIKDKIRNHMERAAC